MATTVYNIRLRYTLNDRASRGLARLGREADRAGKKASFLSRSLGTVATGLVAGFGLHQAGKALIGFNSNLEQSRIQMGGMLAQASAGKVSFEQGFGTATRLVEDFQQIAKASVGTTKDFVDMASMIARPVAAAGLNMKDLKTFTKGAVIASRAFGIEAGMAARDIESALMGQLRSVDRFSRALLEPIIGAGEEGRRAFNELGADQRAAILKHALGSDVINAMAKAQEKSFDGVFSTLQDSLQMTLGKIGLPLMKALTAEIQRWNVWLTANETKVERFAKSVGSGLKSVFSTLKAVGGFISRNRDVLLQVAKAALLFKGVQVATGIIAAPIKWLGSLSGGLESATKGLTGFIGGLGKAVGALGALWVASKAAANFIDKRQNKDLKRAENSVEAVNALLDFQRTTTSGNMFLRAAGRTDTTSRDRQRAGMMGLGANTAGAQRMAASNLARVFKNELRDGKVDRRALAARFGGLSHKARKRLAQQFGFASQDVQVAGRVDQDKIVEAMARRIEAAHAMGGDIFAKQIMKASNAAAHPIMSFLSSMRSQAQAEDASDPLAAARAELDKLKGKGSSRVNININRIEIQDPDPDVFAFRLVSTLSDAAKNPSGAVSRFREG